MAGPTQTVLLIEEEPTLRDVTAFRLDLLGYDVVALGSAEEALAWLQDELPRLVIVGHFLPGLDGADLIDRLSNDVRTSELPVMYLSPNSELDDVQRAFNRRRRRVPGHALRPDCSRTESDAAVGGLGVSRRR